MLFVWGSFGPKAKDKKKNWDSRQLFDKLVPRRCGRRVNAGTQPHCERTSWMFLSWEVGGWISDEIRQTTWLENGKNFGGKHS